MKTLNCFLVIILPLFFIAASCTKEEATSPPDFTIKNAAELITQFNMSKLPQYQGEYVEGSVFLRAATNDMLVVYVDGESLGTKSLIYQIQTNGLANKNFKSSIDEAQIIFTHNNLVINSTKENKSLLLTLSPTDDIVKLESYTKEINGFGLARYLIESSALSSTERFSIGDPPPAEGCVCTSGADLAGCDSGGLGATGCSGAYGPNASQCTVTCAGTAISSACCS